MRKLLVLGTVVVAGFLSTGCNPSYDEGPAGIVVDNDRSYRKNRPWKYEITTEDANGNRTEFKVTGNDYYDCPKGASYPKCTKKS